MKQLLQFLVGRSLVVNLISAMLVLLGLFAAFNINREAFPNVNLDQATISFVYPGATPEEIERLVITPIEQELEALSGIDKMNSVAFPNAGTIMLELDQDSSNRDRIISDVQLAVDRAELPADLPADPVVLEIDGSVFPIIQLAVSAPRSEVEMKRLGDHIKDDLAALDGVARIQILGDRKAELRVNLDPDRLRDSHLSIGSVANKLANWNINAPGGDIDTPEGQKSVRVTGEFSGPDDIEGLVLRANERGHGVTVGDVATVRETLEKASVYYDVGGQSALHMIIMKKADADIIDTVDRVKAYLETIPDQYGSDISYATFDDFSRFTRLRLGILTNNGMVGLVLVFITLMLFLRPSVALTTTWGLPIVFLTGLFALYAYDVTLNLISMFGFIMVLGMLVDDAIIVGENITYHMEQGMAPRKAAVTGTLELLGPVTATIMTTIIAFVPLMFMSGIIGKFIVAIPVVVITLIFFSWLESFLVLPSHVAAVANARAHPRERGFIVAIENAYARVLRIALKGRWLTVILSVAILFGSLVLAKHSSFTLFPAAGIDQYLVRVTAPSGVTLEEMRDIMHEVDSDIRAHINPDYLDATLSSTGKIAIDAGDPLTQQGSRFGQIRVLYIPFSLRPEHDALDDMRRLQKILPQRHPDLTVAFTEVKPGPPTGRALQVEIAGKDSAISQRVATRLEAFLNGVEGVTSVENDLSAGDPELHVLVDRSLAAYAGVDLRTIATHIRAATGGLVVSNIRRGSEEVDVTIRFDDALDKVALLHRLEIPNDRGHLVPLSRLARFEERQGYTTVRHKEGVRVVHILGNVDPDVITSFEINRLVAENEPDWVGADADRVTINYGGEQEKNQESVFNLAVSMLFAVVGIFFILAIQFNNLSYPLLVMLAIPFGMIGIIVSFYLHTLFWKPMPLSFLSMMGMVALAGVVVNSSLVLLVFVQRAIEDGMHHLEALILAGRRRLRAVLLTAATTIVGLLPTAYGWGGLDPFVSPMALALSSGLAFATVITLITIPATFAVSVDIKHLLQRLFRRRRRDEL